MREPAKAFRPLDIEDADDAGRLEIGVKEARVRADAFKYRGRLDLLELAVAVSVSLEPAISIEPSLRRKAERKALLEQETRQGLEMPRDRRSDGRGDAREVLCDRSFGDGDMSYRDPWRIAHQLVLEHRENAGLHAATNVDRTLAKARLNSYRFWREVIDALTEMGRTVPVVGERLKLAMCGWSASDV